MMGVLLLKQKNVKKIITIGTGFLLMYAGFTLLLLPMMISAWPQSLTLTNSPQIFGFEDDLNSVHSISGTPKIIASPRASGSKAVECQSGDHLGWNLAPPSKTIDLSFKVYWTKLPTIANESLTIGEVYKSELEKSPHIFSTNLYCDPKGYRGWSLWSSVPSGHGSFVPSDIVRTLETNRWYSLRITVDLNSGVYKLYMDGVELASIMNGEVLGDTSIYFFRVGSGARGNSSFTTFYDDVVVSSLDSPPPSHLWSVRITSSSGGSTIPNGTITLDDNEHLYATAKEAVGYSFSRWLLDGVEYDTSITVAVPAQPVGTQHTLHAIFRSINFEPNTNCVFLPLQITGVGLIGGGAYALWTQKKRES